MFKKIWEYFFPKPKKNKKVKKWDFEKKEQAKREKARKERKRKNKSLKK